MARIPTHRPPTRPGEILLEEFLKPLDMTQTELAERIGVPIQRVNGIINGRRAVTTDTALRLARLFGTTPDVWLNLQRACDVYEALRAPEARELRRIKPVRAAAGA